MYKIGMFRSGYVEIRVLWKRDRTFSEPVQKPGKLFYMRSSGRKGKPEMRSFGPGFPAAAASAPKNRSTDTYSGKTWTAFFSCEKQKKKGVFSWPSFLRHITGSVLRADLEYPY